MKTESGKLVNLGGLQGIGVHYQSDGVWWLILQGISPWFFGGAWLGPYSTEQDAKTSQDTIEQEIARGYTAPVLFDFSDGKKGARVL